MPRGVDYKIPRDALVKQLDRAVECHPPPVSFQVVRLERVVREFKGVSS
jgi:hypothetical protein